MVQLTGHVQGRSWAAQAAFLALLVACLGLSGCKDKQLERPFKAGEGDPTIPESTQGAETERVYPPEALHYLEQALASPTEGYPALGDCWAVLGSLKELADRPEAAEIRAAVGTTVRASGDQVPPELMVAWLSTHPEQAASMLRKSLEQGQGRYLLALVGHPEHRILLSVFPWDQATSSECATGLELLRQWRAADEADRGMLEAISDREDPGLSWRAEAWRIRLKGEDSAQLLGDLEKILEKAQADKQVVELAAAAEAARIAGREELAGALVSWVAQAKLGPPDPGIEPSAEQIYGAYALGLLRGEDSIAACRKLSAAASPQLAWLGRLGLLLSGEPQAWSQAVDQAGIEGMDLWVALEPPEVISADLIPTYEAALSSKETRVLGSAARHLARYSNIDLTPSDKDRVLAMLTALAKEADAAVRAQALMSASALQYDGLETLAKEALQRQEEPPMARLAACQYLLRIAEGRPR